MFINVKNYNNFLHNFLHFFYMKNVVFLIFLTTFIQIIRAHDEDDEIL